MKNNSVAKNNSPRDTGFSSSQGYPVLSDIQRRHKKHISRYLLKKQASLIEQIIEDPQIMKG